MSHTSPEVDCNCDNQVFIRWDQEGEIKRCVECGRTWAYANDDAEAKEIAG